MAETSFNLIWKLVCPVLGFVQRIVAEVEVTLTVVKPVGCAHDPVQVVTVTVVFDEVDEHPLELVTLTL